TMGFVALRFTAFAMLLHLSQVTPGLSCTFTLLNVTHLTNLNQVASEPGYPKCLEKCYETEDCSYVVLDREGFDCFVYAPGEGEVTRDLFIQPDFYQFDRDVSITSCPTVTPGLSCTFTQFTGANLINVKKVFEHEFILEAAGFTTCSKKCYEFAGCNFFLYNPPSPGAVYLKPAYCAVYGPGEDETSRGDYQHPEIYRFDRNAFNTSCPTVRQWTEQNIDYLYADV
ncbi:hypothetical protein TELCIR_16203, partial [Teladorsagia circumcincta]